jgi:hypothetical protein
LVIAEAEEIAEEAAVLGGLQLGLRLLAELVKLLFSVFQLLFGLVERVLLDQDGLGHDVEGIGVAAELLEDELLGFGVFFSELGLVDAVGEVLQELLFLRCHVGPRVLPRKTLPETQVCGTGGTFTGD